MGLSGYNTYSLTMNYSGQGRVHGGDKPPPKIEKNMIFWRKIVIFHTKYPKNVPCAIGKNIIFGVKS